MPFDRRNFLRATALLPIAARELIAAPRRYLLQMNGYPINAETPLELLTDYLTPNDLFFVRSHWIPHPPDAKQWKLTIDGEVDHPLTLSLADLRKMPRAEATCVLQCAGNGRGFQQPVVPGVQWRYGAAGNAKWTGVRVRDVLEHAGMRDPAKHLHLFGSDDPPQKVPPFHRSIEMEKAMSDAILAWEMNGVALPVSHGAPLRLIVPGWAGDHWMKWLVRLSPQPDSIKGFYMETAYRWPNAPGAPGVAFKPEEMHPVTELAVKSNITTVPKSVRVDHEHRESWKPLPLRLDDRPRWWLHLQPQPSLPGAYNLNSDRYPAVRGLQMRQSRRRPREIRCSSSKCSPCSRRTAARSELFADWSSKGQSSRSVTGSPTWS